MKNMSIAIMLMFFLALTASDALPLSYRFDFNGDEIWDNEWESLVVGDTVKLDIWLDGYLCSPDDELFGAQLYFLYDPDRIDAKNAFPNDSNNGGPFDSSLSGFEKQEDGVYSLVASNFGYVTINSGKILLGTIELESLTLDKATIRAASSLDLTGNDDGFVSDCNLENQFPGDAVAEINGNTSVTTIPHKVSPGVTLTVENGSGPPGSQNNPFQITLENTTHKVRGLELEVCDEDDYLTIEGCETTDRSDALSCEVNELTDGCVRVFLFSATSNDLIQEGTGPVLTLNSTISDDAPDKACRDLILDNVSVADEYNQPLEHALEAGEFCFSSSPTTDPSTTIPSTTTVPPSTTIPSTTIPSTITSTTTSADILCPVEQVYGQSSEEAELLRYVRDYLLIRTPAGRELIRLYYMWSPLIVMIMQDDKEFNELISDTINDMLQFIIKEAR